LRPLLPMEDAATAAGATAEPVAQVQSQTWAAPCPFHVRGFAASHIDREVEPQTAFVYRE
jgi:hypothetical protein